MNQRKTIACQNCGTVNRSSAKFCNQCHAPLETLAQETAPLPAPVSPETVPLPVAPQAPFPERPTQRLGKSTGLTALPEGAIIGKYEVRQLVPVQPGINSYLVADAQNQLSLMFEAENLRRWVGEKRLFDMRLAHSAIASLVDVFEQVQYEAHPRAYLVTEYPIAPLAQAGAPSEFDAVSWGVQLAGGLAYLHDNNLVHGNIQPTSIVMTSNKQVKWWNFASAQPLTAELRDWDIHQLAKTLYQLATSTGQATWSSGTAQVFARALAQDPHQRYHDARSFAEDLENAVNTLRHPQGIEMRVGRITDVGQAREVNEDAFITLEGFQTFQKVNQAVGLFVVADGMGGAAAGEVASRMVVQTLSHHVLTNVFVQHFSDQPAHLDHGAILKAAVEHANTEVNRARDAAHNDMGSTAVAALVVENQAHIVNVGDSRAYLITPDHIEKITKDHSFVQALVDRNEIGEDDVYTHPQRNFILRNIGDKPQVQADLFTHTFEPGQFLLLCSDGLWEMVHPKRRLHEIVTGAPNVQEACKQLVDAANENGGHDNITVVLVKFESA